MVNNNPLIRNTYIILNDSDSSVGEVAFYYIPQYDFNIICYFIVIITFTLKFHYC